MYKNKVKSSFCLILLLLLALILNSLPSSAASRTRTMTTAGLSNNFDQPLASGEPLQRANVAAALVKLGYQPTNVLSILLSTVKQRDIGFSQPVVEALSILSDRVRQSGQVEEILPYLIEASRTGNAQLREAAVRAVGTVGRGNPESMARLVECLSDSDAFTRASAISGLGTFATQARPALAQIRNALDDPEPFVRQAAIGGLALLQQG